MAVDIWGWCGTCEDWFACAGWFNRAAPCPTCPACGAEPHAIENRAAARNVILPSGPVTV